MKATNFSPECECGHPKSKWVDACERCRFLDGGTSVEFEIIQLLREVPSGLTIATMCFELDRLPESVLRTLQRLRRRGRVESLVWEGTDRPGKKGRPPMTYRLVEVGR